MNEITINLTKSQAENLVEFFDLEFIQHIREDYTVDNMAYIVDMSEVYDKLTVAVRVFEKLGESFGDMASAAEALRRFAGDALAVSEAPARVDVQWDEKKRLTNLDRIRGMSAEELAVFIDKTCGGCNCCVRADCENCSDCNCVDNIRAWLTEAAK